MISVKRVRILPLAALLMLLSSIFVQNLSAQHSYWWTIARSHVLAENYSKALTFYMQAVAMHPANGLLHAEYAYALHKSGDYEQALNEYFLSLGFPNVNRDEIRKIKFNIAVVYAETGEYGKALGGFTELLDSYPDFSEAYLNKANLEVIMRNYRDAEDSYGRFLELEPESPLTPDILAMLELLKEFSLFPASDLNKEEYDRKRRYETELQERLNRVGKDAAVQPNSFLGEGGEQ